MTEPISGSPARPPSGGRAVSPVTVLVTNLLVGGCLGYFLLGQKKKGIAAVVLFVLLAIPTWCAGSLLISLITAVDGYLQAMQAESGHAIGEWTFFNAYNG